MSHEVELGGPLTVRVLSLSLSLSLFQLEQPTTVYATDDDDG